MKDFDFQIKRNQEDITVIKEKIEGVSKDLDDLVSLYEIVSEQMNPFVGLSNVTKRRIEALENFTKEVDEIKQRMDDIEALAEKGGLQRAANKELEAMRKRMMELEDAQLQGGANEGNSRELEMMRKRMKELEAASREQQKAAETRLHEELEKASAAVQSAAEKKVPESNKQEQIPQPEETIKEPDIQEQSTETEEALEEQPDQTEGPSEPSAQEEETDEIEETEPSLVEEPDVPDMMEQQPEDIQVDTPQIPRQEFAQPVNEGAMMGQPAGSQQNTQMDDFDTIFMQALQAIQREQELDRMIDEFLTQIK